jgi:hypothetical protein
MLELLDLGVELGATELGATELGAAELETFEELDVGHAAPPTKPKGAG